LEINGKGCAGLFDCGVTSVKVIVAKKVYLVGLERIGDSGVKLRMLCI